MIKPEEHIQTVNSILNVAAANGLIYLTAQYATPIISFFTAGLSLYYIVRKIKKEFFSDGI